MGIQGLLAFLKPLRRPARLQEYAGKTVGVDAMCWMHKGAFACAQELVLGQDTDRFIVFFLRMCEVLKYNKVKPVIVFDGAKLPAKAIEDARRQDGREKARDEALELFERKSRGEFVDEHKLSSLCGGAIRVTSDMISRLMTALQELGIHFMVAPYEADAQLAYMCRVGWVHSVISEDSDLLAYGCPSSFFKMDKFGNGEGITLPCLQPGFKPMVPLAEPGCESPKACTESPKGKEEPDADGGKEEPNEAELEAEKGNPEGKGRGRGRGRGATKKPKTPKTPKTPKKKEQPKKEEKFDINRFQEWTPEVFTEFCVLCGSDYKEHDVHIKGLGIKTAFQLITQHKSVYSVLEMMEADTKKWKLPCTFDEYLARFRSVLTVFWHHVVFDPRRGECLSISTAFPNVDRMIPGIDPVALCGTGVTDKSVAVKIAKGEIDARNKELRKHEPLTPAERNSLNRMLERKRNEQRDYQFDQQLKRDAERLRLEREEREEAAEAALAAKALDLAAGDNIPAVDLTEQDTPCEDQPNNVEPEKREVCVLSSDLDAIFAIVDEVDARGPGSRPSDDVFGGQFDVDMVRTQTAKTSNPFAAHKRAAPSARVSGVVLGKRPRLCGSTANGRDVTGRSQSPARPSENSTSHSPKDAASTPEKVERMLAAPELHRNGGSAAKEAATAVLFQRGLVEFKPLADHLDRRKLTSFFSLKTQKPTSTQATTVIDLDSTAVKTGLAAWKAQPWKKDEDGASSNPFRVTSNALSMEASRPKNMWKKY